MNKETIQKLVNVHNILFNMSVTGDAVIPMAQALVLLQGVLGETLRSQQDPTLKKGSDDAEQNDTVAEEEA